MLKPNEKDGTIGPRSGYRIHPMQPTIKHYYIDITRRELKIKIVHYSPIYIIMAVPTTSVKKLIIYGGYSPPSSPILFIQILNRKNLPVDNPT